MDTEDENIEHPWISKAIENSQKKVEAHNSDIRKTVLEYDDVMNQQRLTIYAKRREIMDGQEIKDKVLDMIDTLADGISQEFAGPIASADGLKEKILKQFGLSFEFDGAADDEIRADDLGQKIYDEALAFYEKKESELTPDILRQVERYFMLQTLDNLWKDHLLAMDHLREGIGLRGYGQKDPKMEYKKEGFSLFEGMIRNFCEDSIEKLFKVQIQKGQEVPVERHRQQPMQMGRPELPTGKSQGEAKPTKPVTQERQYPRVGRNDPCPCGSGNKYKKCHGKD